MMKYKNLDKEKILMKKMMFLLLVFMLMFSFSTVLADPSDEPILFRGIPWSITPADALDELDGWETSNEKIDFDYLFSGNSEGQPGINSIISKMDNPNINVAGYKPNTIELYFVYAKVQNGSLDRSEENSELCMGRYYFWNPKSETNSMREDIKTKLSILYGDIDESPSDKCDIWYGADETMVSVYLGGEASGKQALYISYTNGGCKKALALDMEGL